MIRSGSKTNDDISVAIVNSQRFQAGVEILEREVHLTTTCDVPLSRTVKPRLVITDALASATEFIVSKTRAEVEGLNALMQSLALVTPALK